MNNKISSFFLPDEAATIAFAKSLARTLSAGGIIYLQGDLGAGKTTLVRAVLHALGYPGKVKSPTYTIIEPYEFENHVVVHIDLYRMVAPEELEYLGLTDLLNEETLCFIEWPQMGRGEIPDADLIIEIEHKVKGRQINLHEKSSIGKKIVKNIQY